MKKFFQGPLHDHARNFLRRLGYSEIRTRSGQISYAKRVGPERYPRYHAYVEDTENGLQVNLHIDQKEASYEGTKAHAGEYEGPLVEKEMTRISQVIETKNPPAASPQQPAAKKTFLSKFFS